MERKPQVPWITVDKLSRTLARYGRGERLPQADLVGSRMIDSLIQGAMEARVRLDGGDDRDRARALKKIRRALGYTYP